MTIVQFAIARECQRQAERAVAGEEINPAGYLMLAGCVDGYQGDSDANTGLIQAVASDLRNSMRSENPEPSTDRPCSRCGHSYSYHAQDGPEVTACRRPYCRCKRWVE